MADETEFPETLWPDLCASMARGGADAVIAQLMQLADDEQRRKGLSFAVNAFSNRDWDGKNLDAVIAIAEAGMTEGQRQADEASDDDTRRARIDFANIVSYNLSAALAECWPGDETARERRHFARGLAAAEACLAWRRELAKGAVPFCMAHWAEGMHLLSLGEHDRAVEALGQSLQYAERAAEEESKSSALGPDGTYFVLLGHGYLGLAERAAGDAGGEQRYENARNAFAAQVAEGGETGDDAQFGIDQLRKVDERLGRA